jgi:hypothetical protein
MANAQIKRVMLLFSLILSLYLITGSVSQNYVHSIDSLGMSTIEETTDISSFINLFPQGSLTNISAACKNTQALSCSLNDTILSMRLTIPSENNYYSYESDSGFPIITNTFILERLPTELFDERVNAILAKAGVSEGKGISSPIDFRENESNKLKAEAYAQSGISMNYTLVMPNGKRSSYDVVKLLEESKPIVIITQELNLWLLSLVLGLAVLVAFAFSFFRMKKKK